MSAEKRSSNEYSDAAKTKGHKVESKRGSRQQQWTTSVKDNLSPPRSKSSKFQDNSSVVNPHGDHKDKRLNQRSDNKHAVQLQFSTTGRKHQLESKKIRKEDELVKYMSNLPGYLQQAEKQKNVQVKALNFGVLDWKRLEKWKYSEQILPKGQPKQSSGGGSSLSMESGKSASIKTSVGRKHCSADVDFKVPDEVRLSEDAEQLVRKAKPIHDPQTGAKISVQQQDFSQSGLSSSRNCPPITHDKGKTKEPNRFVRAFSMSSLPSGKQHDKSRRTLDSSIDDSAKYCNAEAQNIVLLKPKCSSKRSSTYVPSSSASSDGQLAMDAGDRCSSQEPQSREFNHEFVHSCPLPSGAATRVKVLNDCIFPCQSEKSAEALSSDAKSKVNATDDCPVSIDTPKVRNTGTTQKTESRASSGRHSADASRNRNSDWFSQEIHSTELQSEILHTSPLFANTAGSQGRGSDDWTFHNDNSTEPRLSNATCPESKSCHFEDSVSIESFNEVDLAFVKQTSRRGKHPSPNKRFSFSSLSRLSRSFSFKESSTSAELSSTHSVAESCSEKYEASASIADSKRENANASSRRRPSPFRRLLDPLLKPILAHSTEAVHIKGAQYTEKNPSFATSNPNNRVEPLSSATNSALPFEALMQLTVKNGVPFFKFVVDNRSDILAAALKQLPSTGKADCSLAYSFYSVHEIKKKPGGWITNGLKGKNCGFGYNVVGQMKLSRYCLSELNSKDHNQHSFVTESVLYDMSISGGDKVIPEVSPNREIAAIIVKQPIANCNNLEPKAGNVPELQQKDHGNSTRVILPGAVHSLPSNGAPSSLIQRWKSGGLCDCGGWDVGCKLKILSDRDQASNFSTPSMSCSSPERMNLFIQGVDIKGQPILSMAPVQDGLYSVEFHPSVSLLEGFSICVAVITSRDFADIFDMSNLADSQPSVEANSGNDEKKKEIKLQGEIPVKYMSSPPSSPVGRI